MRIKRIIEKQRQPPRKTINLTSTMRVILAGLMSKFRLANKLWPRKMNASSCKNNIRNNEETDAPVNFPDI